MSQNQLNANGQIVKTKSAEKFVVALLNRDNTQTAMFQVLALGPDHATTLDALNNQYSQLDEQVRTIGRSIFGSDFDTNEGKHKPTSWRNLSSANVMLA